MSQINIHTYIVTDRRCVECLTPPVHAMQYILYIHSPYTFATIHFSHLLTPFRTSWPLAKTLFNSQLRVLPT